MICFAIVAEPMVGTHDADVAWRKRIELIFKSYQLIWAYVPHGDLSCDEHRFGAVKVLYVSIEEVCDHICAIGVAWILWRNRQCTRLNRSLESAVLTFPVVDGQSIEIGAVVGIAVALFVVNVVPDGDDSKTGFLKVSLRELRVFVKRLSFDNVTIIDCVVSIVGHSVAES